MSAYQMKKKLNRKIKKYQDITATNGVLTGIMITATYLFFGEGAVMFPLIIFGLIFWITFGITVGLMYAAYMLGFDEK